MPRAGATKSGVSSKGNRKAARRRKATVRKRARRSAKSTAPNPLSGTLLEETLRQEGLYEDASAVAIKRVLAWEIAQAMQTRGISKAQLARGMGTSRSALDRLLDPENDSVTLRSLARAASVLESELRVELITAEDA